MPGLPTFNVSPGPFGDTLYTGGRDVAVNNVAISLNPAGALKCLRVWIQAKKANANAVYVGPSSVLNTGANGIYLDKGVVLQLDFLDISNLYVNGSAGDGVTFIYWA